MSDFVIKQIESLVHGAEPLLGTRSKEEILGADLAKLAGPLMSKKEVPVTAVLRLALLNDCLRIAERVVRADGTLSEAEVRYLYPLLRHVAPLLGRLRASYAEYERLAPAEARDLLQQHESDGQPFGGTCKRSEWSGFAACRHLAKLSGSADPLKRYAALMSRLIEEVASHGGGTAAEDGVSQQLRELVRDQTKIDDELSSKPDVDALGEAFCAADGVEVFHAVAHAAEIWERDPYDVDVVHSEARQHFDAALDRVRDASSSFGRSFVVLGESGAGKTHLLRAFRAMAHGSWRAFTGYVQLNVSTDDYPKLLVRRLVESMDRAYDPPMAGESGLMVLSDALVKRIAEPGDDRIERLRDADLTHDQLSRLTNELADAGYNNGLGELHADILRAFLLLQRRDTALRQRVLKLLRCEHLSAYEREMLGDIAPWTDDTSANRMLVQLGKLAWEAHGAAVLLLVDQVEDLQQQGNAKERFRRVADTIRWVTDELPHCLVVLASLEDFFSAYAKDLTRAVRDRLERDPDPVRLTSDRRRDEIHEIVARRLAVLYGERGLEPSDEQPLHPFSAEQLEAVRNLRTRDVIDWCAVYHRRCRDAGRLVGVEETRGGSVPTVGAPQSPLDARWAEAQQQDGPGLPEDDASLVELIGWGFERLGEELGATVSVAGTDEDARLFELRGGSSAKRLYCGLSNKMPQGGHLAKQLSAMADAARSQDASLVLLRSGEFPARPRTKIAELLGQLVKGGARKVVVADEELRTLAKLRAFREQHDPAELERWAKAARPISELKLYAQLLDGLPAPPTARPPTPEPEPAKAKTPVQPPKNTRTPNGKLALGHGLGLKGEPVTIDGGTLTKHAAIVGATGSGKTTLALTMLEQLLASGTPVLMLDRKGDLCTYADPAFWNAEESDPERAQRKRELRERVDVKVFTPGDSRGRPLSIQVAPIGLGELPSAVRGPAATHAASALAGMLSIKVQPHEQKLAILAKGIEILAETGSAVTIERLTEIIGNRDADLMNQVGMLKDGHFDTLFERLRTLKLLNSQLFESGGDALSGDLLFGRGTHATNGKTRLSIISTKGLRNDDVIEFWVAQLLSELLAWASRNPSPKLQAVVFLDEADLYLPATSKPATKEPVLDLLKRGRSAGLSVMLGTQNPGDFDYKARANLNAWFLGRVSQVNDLRRMKPLLSEARTDVTGKLANAGRGEFYLLVAGNVTPFQATRSLMETRQLGEDEILALAERG